MDKLLSVANRLKTLLVSLTEAGFAAIAFIVLIYLLLGENSGDFVLSVITNLSIMVNLLTPNALIGMAIVLMLGVILRRKG